MTLTPISIPPGMYRNGTPYSARGRWADGNLIRFDNGAVESVGGWEERGGTEGLAALVTVSTETIRDMITYKDTLGRSLGVIGSNAALYHINSGNIVSDVTPVGFVGGVNVVVNEVGYGVGSYGVGAYGTPRNPEDVPAIPVSRWSFDVWGENALAVFTGGGSLYEFVPDAVIATAIATAPEDMIDIVVTKQRIVMGIRNTSGDVREVLWCDREDNTNWVPTITNFAGSAVLEGTGNLVGVYKVQTQILILSENDAHVGTYVGAPFVYGFSQVGEGCGPVDRAAVAMADRFAMWYSDQVFWMYDGSISIVECDVMDYLQNDMDTRQFSKMFTVAVPKYKELWWFYQSSTSSEVDSYVIYNHHDKHWTTGKLPRTAGAGKGAYNSLVMISAGAVVYNHEQSAIVPDGEAYVTSGPLELENGNINTCVGYVFLDNAAAGDVTVEFKSRQLPNEVETSYGIMPYMDPLSTTGVAGRQLSVTFRGQQLGWKVGTMRLKIQDQGGGFR